MTVVKEFPRPAPDLVAAFRGQSPATLHEAMGKKGAMSFPIKPLYQGMTLFGTAVTVSGGPTDNLMIHAAMALTRPGDVLVVDFKGMTEAGPWGDVLTEAAIQRGLAGLVIDGCVRDAAAIRQMGFPVFCRGTSMKGTTKTQPTGDVNTPIVCGGVMVMPGDILVGDDDGVVVVPQAEAAATLAKAAERERMEEGLRGQLRAGRTTVEALTLEPYLEAGGIAL
ncbi:4-carboxy-4-hydroxy-2-oxoadipate aldolase/oxaloacetate decarboxylase [Azospirillum tabaci]|uniref:4-carboxy-4-hydroxy-2-oxoadipate aldolase/oxaloacetate decarboxylase n=1 Tax=Azospirillum tabaci TaxID=2752310 RepID=UPI001660EE94|nr:4-carboxy-4-hydroxy-2-oxoadipate aldolase/oxaloacetate decarboxylase [Azospirillum tabaci]